MKYDPKTKLPEVTWTPVVGADGYRIRFERRHLFQTKPVKTTRIERIRYWLGDLLEDWSWRLRDGI